MFDPPDPHINPKRLKSLKEVCNSQEGQLAPSYQVHKLQYVWDPTWQAPFLDLPGLELQNQKFEIEATDLIWPYFDGLLRVQSLLQELELRYYLNESRNDRMIFGDRYRKSPVKNFPFYKINFQLITWPGLHLTKDFELEFYTFTNPRVIQDLRDKYVSK